MPAFAKEITVQSNVGLAREVILWGSEEKICFGFCAALQGCDGVTARHQCFCRSQSDGTFTFQHYDARYSTCCYSESKVFMCYPILDFDYVIGRPADIGENCFICSWVYRNEAPIVLHVFERDVYRRKIFEVGKIVLWYV